MVLVNSNESTFSRSIFSFSKNRSSNLNQSAIGFSCANAIGQEQNEKIVNKAQRYRLIAIFYFFNTLKEDFPTLITYAPSFKPFKSTVTRPSDATTLAFTLTPAAV